MLKAARGMLLASLMVVVDPIVSLQVTAHLVPRIACAAECHIETAALEHVTGEVAVAAPGGGCHETVLLTRLPFGAHLVPRVTYRCGGRVGQERGAPVTIAPYLTNVVIDGTTVWVPALAEPRGPERLRLQVTADGLDVSEEFKTRELVMRGVKVPWGRVQVRATLEPYGRASNTRTVYRRGDDSARVEAEGAGCASSAWVLVPALFRRRRFPFPRGFC